MSIFARAVNAVVEFSGRIISVLAFVITAIILYEIFSRFLFNAPTRWAHESSVYLFGTYIMLGGAFALKNDEHVRVDILANRFSTKWQRYLRVFGMLTVILFSVALLWKGWGFGLRSLLSLEHSSTMWNPPVYPLKLMIPLGALILCLQALANIIIILQDKEG